MASTTVKPRIILALMVSFMSEVVLVLLILLFS